MNFLHFSLYQFNGYLFDQKVGLEFKAFLCHCSSDNICRYNCINGLICNNWQIRYKFKVTLLWSSVYYSWGNLYSSISLLGLALFNIKLWQSYFNFYKSCLKNIQNHYIFKWKFLFFQIYLLALLIGRNCNFFENLKIHFFITKIDSELFTKKYKYTLSWFHLQYIKTWWTFIAILQVKSSRCFLHTKKLLFLYHG